VYLLMTLGQFIMDFELKIARTTYREAIVEGVVMAVSYGIGKSCMASLARPKS